MRTSRITTLILIMSTAGACNKISFSPLSANENTESSSNPEVIAPVDPPVSGPLLKTGSCNLGDSISSCLSCQTDPVPPPVATKAQKLAKIMSMACQISNKSYPKDYVAPTADQVQEKLAACSPDLYPETPMTSSQSAAIDQLLDPADSSLRQKMFKGIWYQPPFTEYFENYFGLDNTEAVNVICMNNGPLPSTLATKEYLDALADNYDAWLANPSAQKRWQFAQMLRQQLLSCLSKPAPPPQPTPLPIAKKCRTRSFEGNFEQGGLDEIKDALGKGFKLSIEANNACVQVKDPIAAQNLKGKLKIISFKCE